MINNEELENKYKEHKKIYIPEQYKNQNYKYTINNDEITIITDNNCYTNYNSIYCDCYRYNEKYNIITESYSCNNNAGNYVLNYNTISSDINNSYRITRDFVNEYTIIILSIILAMIFVTLFKKNSRRI